MNWNNWSNDKFFRVVMLTMVTFVLLTFLVLSLCGTAHAAVDPPAPPASPAIDLSGLGNTVAQAIFTNLNDWFQTWATTSGPLSIPVTILRGFMRAMGWLGRNTMNGLADSQGGDLNMIGQFSIPLTLDDPTVRQIAGLNRSAVVGIVGLGATLLGLLLITRQGNVSLQDGLLFIPRLGIGAILVGQSMNILRGVLTLSNTLSSAFLQDAWQQINAAAGAVSDEEAGGIILAMAVAAAFLVTMRVAMHGVLDLVIMIAPIAFAVWMVPMWSHWFWKWAQVLGALAVVNVLQVMLIAATGGMLGRAASGAGENRDLVTGVIAVSLMATSAVIPAMAGLTIGGIAVGGAIRHAARPMTLRPKSRALAATSQAQDNPVTTDVVEDAEFTEKEVRFVGHGPALAGHTVVMERIPMHGAVRQGSSGERPQLPPPDYLEYDRFNQRPMD